VAVRERTLSDFLQHSGQVLAEVAEGEILLHRRDGEDVVLMTQGQREALGTALRVAFALTSHDTEAVTAILPWLAFLALADREGCLRDLREVSAVAIHTGRLSRLEEILYTWEATGLAAWDDLRNRQRAGYADEEPIEVPRPERA